MANAVNVNFRMDPDLKRNMEEVCAEMGLSMTTAFTIFAKKVSREHRIPFEVFRRPVLLGKQHQSSPPDRPRHRYRKSQAH